MSYHNVRDAKGKFTSASNVPALSTMTLTSVSVSGCPRPMGKTLAQSGKDFFLDKLRNGVYKTTHVKKNGATVTNSFTLMPSYLTGYVGRGNSKSAPSDLIFAYEVNDKRFYGIDVPTISLFEIE